MNVLWISVAVLASIVYLQIGWYIARFFFDDVDAGEPALFVGSFILWPLAIAICIAALVIHLLFEGLAVVVTLPSVKLEAWIARRKNQASSAPPGTDAETPSETSAISPIGRIGEINAQMESLAAEKAAIELRPDAARH